MARAMIVPQNFVVLTLALAIASGATAAPDACAKIGGKKWAAPADVRACYKAFKLDNAIKNNVIDVVNKTLAFHTSTSYQIQAPPPFDTDVHVNLPLELARIKRQSYDSEYDFHVDLLRTVKRLNDGHCAWNFACYDSLYINYLPIPLVLITDGKGKQHVHIAPEAFAVASAEFPDQIEFWQNSLPFHLRGKLESLSGAKVLLINGLDPWVAVNSNTVITGNYQAFGTRQKAFFSSYQRGPDNWNYFIGNFAQQALPLADNILLTIQRKGAILADTILMPYRSRISTTTVPFTGTASWRTGNCVAKPDTNGVDLNSQAEAEDPNRRFKQQPPVPIALARKHPLSVFTDEIPSTTVVLPQHLQPSLPPVQGSRSVSQFYLLDDKKTGVLALGSFADTVYDPFLIGMLEGLHSLKALGATRLIIDVTNNHGGFVCAAHWLHRIIAGPKNTTVPQAGLYTKARAGPLSLAIVDEIVKNPEIDPLLDLRYNPRRRKAINNEFFDAKTNWLRPVQEPIINGVKDAFSPRLGQECQPEGFPSEPQAPAEALFDPKKVAIISNGQCGSACSLFAIPMAKYEGAKTVVLGGKSDVRQQYCGVIGGQSLDFRAMDTEVKTTQLKNHPLAPPDLLVSGSQGISWRLAYGIDNPEEPAEWQDHPADVNLPITAELLNNPVAIWEEVTRKVLG